MAFTLTTVAAAAICAGLGGWQLSRLADRRALNAEAKASREAGVVDLADPDRPPALDQRMITTVGRFDLERTFVLRSRPHRGFPGVEVVIPLRIEGSDTAVLVNLGFAPAADAVHLDRSILQLPDSGRVTGLALSLPDQPAMAQPVASRGDTTWRHVTPSAARARLPYPVFSVMVYRAASDSSRNFPRALPLPPLDDGPHLSYAVQWFSFATIALVGGALWLRKHRIAIS